MQHNLFPQLITLNEETHTYTDNSGQRYMGFSQVYGYISKSFDKYKEHIASAIANKNGTSQQAVLDEWQLATDTGTLIDNLVTAYAKDRGQTASPEHKLLIIKHEDKIKSILSHYSDYHKTYEQLVVYNQEYRVATAIDKLGLVSNRKDCAFEMSDFKCFEKMDLFEDRGWLKEPFEHWQANKYNKIAMQLSYNMCLLETLTGRRCKKLFIHLIKPSSFFADNEPLVQEIVPVPYMKLEVKMLLDYLKEEIKARMNEAVPNEPMSIEDLL